VSMPEDNADPPPPPPLPPNDLMLFLFILLLSMYVFLLCKLQTKMIVFSANANCKGWTANFKFAFCIVLLVEVAQIGIRRVRYPMYPDSEYVDTLAVTFARTRILCY